MFSKEEYHPLASSDLTDNPSEPSQPKHRHQQEQDGNFINSSKPSIIIITLLDRTLTASLRTIHLTVLVLEVCLLGLLGAGFIMLNATRQNLLSDLASSSRLDGLHQLGAYNTTMSFHNNSELLLSSDDADVYWARLLESGGVVSLDTEWALDQGLQVSAESPTDSSQSIYQVDVFHALHCLNSIRENLMSDTPPPFDQKHMTHCLDYVRHQLLCHPDLTLIKTNDLEEFVLTDPHTCRDYGAVLDWVDRHRWPEFHEWLHNKTAS